MKQVYIFGTCNQINYYFSTTYLLINQIFSLNINFILILIIHNLYNLYFMDLPTLITSAFILVKPFLEKTQDGIARKIGEDVWNLIKKPFIKKGNDNIEDLAKTDLDTVKIELQKYLLEDEVFTKQLTDLVNQSNNLLSGNFQQNITSNDKVEKQINIQTNTGSIQM